MVSKKLRLRRAIFHFFIQPTEAPQNKMVTVPSLNSKFQCTAKLFIKTLKGRHYPIHEKILSLFLRCNGLCGNIFTERWPVGRANDGHSLGSERF